MRRVRRWSATLTEPGLLGLPIVLRPMRIVDVRACYQARTANRAWLSPWEASRPEEPELPSPASRLGFAARGSAAHAYAVAAHGRLRARLGIAASWAIHYDGQFAGQLSVFRIAWGPLRSAEVGYWVDQRLAGRGIAPTAVAMIVDHSFQVMGLHRMEACIQPRNVASRRTVEKLGFHDEGIRVGQVHVNGAWCDHVCYALTAEEVPGGLLPRWRDAMNGRPQAR